MTTLCWIIVSGLLMSAIALVGRATLLLTEARLRALLLPMVALAADALHKFIGGLAVAGAFLIDVRVGRPIERQKC